MSTGDKASNAVRKAKGKAEEEVGKAVGNERMTARGKADQVAGDLKQAAEKVKDALRD
ncbi:CsbD family protein [Kitasatospora sp. NPDC085464]|uniref:CsbD family protein n=1 Tax=Kitasatospora sp. NPDC085464 TaxID=3364063 RepID=UPI0037C5CCF7